MLFVKNPYRKEFPGIHNDPNITPNGIHRIEIFEYGPVKVEEDHYFMMGDNRDHSNDSRFWGSVPYKLIIGKPWLIYFSWDNETKKVRWDRVGTFVDDLQYDEPRY